MTDTVSRLNERIKAGTKLMILDEQEHPYTVDYFAFVGGEFEEIIALLTCGRWRSLNDGLQVFELHGGTVAEIVQQLPPAE